ncbi:glucose 1-dehydrogenase [Wenzhouxiangella marina]|uniref:Short-chain dehydrogenase/reductase SDR n=1 Tax=Wenzhouxiangella marina TaxID=1579979 RepID=A0A0K0XTM7_9GAMM|nr:glucose 1-dehydrogenase [Wenzhouxiangella marina]AKS40977.1 Short-chain dehydrogenase/reductase SDR [Wenzhouxiangella marina]MBB6087851.1 NAD(P)-dependent dehydrogenase (short-subunit alcohol dehydrogenase family) [Wenzhouxiangella marina]
MFAMDSVALVTGAATGIGRAIAEVFAREGCRVVLSDRDAQRGEQAARALKETGAEAVFMTADVSDPGAVEALHERIMQRFGRLDAACNNAGIEGEQAPTAECSLDNFDRVIGVNLRGVFLCMKAQLGIMAAQEGGGAIVNMASVAGLVGFAGLPAYCASKGGVIQLTRAAALEYAESPVRVNAVCPGAIKTEMIDRITREDPAAERQFAALHPMNRMGTAEEVAEAVAWLCSPRSGFVTGQALAVDGGLVAR